jgi:hypothetical protein
MRFEIGPGASLGLLDRRMVDPAHTFPAARIGETEQDPC